MIRFVIYTCRLHIRDMLTKCLSWLIGVKSRSYSSNCISSIISMLSYCFEGVIQFQVVTWALGLKMWLKSQGHWHKTEQNSPWMLACKHVRASRGTCTLACPYNESIQRSSRLKAQWDLGAGQGNDWDALWESVVGVCQFHFFN